MFVHAAKVDTQRFVIFGRKQMVPFFDLHSHMLCNVDDGASNREEMLAMLEAAYADGTRAICFTPHYSPYHYGDTSKASAKAFSEICDYAKTAHPDMKLFLGHELGFYDGCIGSLERGNCRTLANSRYVLVDFPEAVSFFEIRHGIEMLLRNGYIPVLAHAERYQALQKQLAWIEDFVLSGGIVQVNASSACGGWGNYAKKQFVKLLRKELVHIVSSDAHNMTRRPPSISCCMPVLKKYCSEETICNLVWNNAWRIVQDKPL